MGELGAIFRAARSTKSEALPNTLEALFRDRDSAFLDREDVWWGKGAGERELQGED